MTAVAAAGHNGRSRTTMQHGRAERLPWHMDCDQRAGLDLKAVFPGDLQEASAAD